MPISHPQIQEFFAFDPDVLASTFFVAVEQILRDHFSPEFKPSAMLKTSDESIACDSLAELEAMFLANRSVVDLVQVAALEKGKHFQVVVQFRNLNVGPNGNIHISLGDKVVGRAVRDLIWKRLDLMPQKFPMMIPSDLDSFVNKFRKDHPPAVKTALLVMSFSESPAHKQIHSSVKMALDRYQISTLRVDDKEYAPDMFNNIRTYMHGCTFGVVVYERIHKDDFNPNVSLEAGYMMALQKPV